MGIREKKMETTIVYRDRKGIRGTAMETTILGVYWVYMLWLLLGVPAISKLDSVFTSKYL